MKVALLGSKDTFHLSSFIEEFSDSVFCCDKPLSLEWLRNNKVEFIVSYGYGFILKPDIIEAYKKKSINLHISYLPWGRGRSPLFWDLIEGNPKGVTIHYLDEGIDTGDIIAQERLAFELFDDTFRVCFSMLQRAVEQLFYRRWWSIRNGRCSSYKQTGGGSYHAPNDMEKYKHLLYAGWDTPVQSFAKVENVNYCQMNREMISGNA